MNPLADRAAVWGIETEYEDARGQQQLVPPRAIEAILRILESLELPPQDTVMPPALVLRGSRATRLDLARVEPQTPVQWVIADSDTILAEGGGPAHDCAIAANLPVGVYRLEVKFRTPSGEQRHATPLLVAPDRAFQGREPDRRDWALAVQLYGVRSRRNWGHGDFTDLAALIDLAAEIGAAGIGVNPLHALFDDRLEHPSPYAPNSRLFLNPLYIDVEAVPEFPGCQAAGLHEAIERLRQCDQVDYPGVARAKTAGLRLAYDRFRAAPDPERRRDFEQYQHEQGISLARFASFEVLRRRFPTVWWEWPAPWRKPDETALAALRDSDGDEVTFYEFVQWIADRQLAACQDKARQRGLPIGLYLDVAVGADAGGADAWSEQISILSHLSVGAPPDIFNPDGQNWGIAGFHPRGLAAEAFTPFRRTVAAAMRRAGAIRIDHVLALNRLFLIPHGAPAQDGAYFRFPLEALLAVVAQESVARQCIVVGEDLGTVPSHLRAVLADWGIWSYRVLMFERAADRGFIAPEHYPRDAVATFSTHDLPTYQGWMTGYDLRLRRDIGYPSGETEDQRDEARGMLHDAMAHAGCIQGGGFVDIARFLAATPSRLVVVAIEDVLGMMDQPNVPATTDEHPNWKRRLPLTLEEWSTHQDLRALAQVFRQSGRGSGGAQ